MGLPRIVLDTNIWVAARFNPKSYSAKILDAIGEGKLVLLWSHDTKRELDRILANTKAYPQFLAAKESIFAAAIDVGETEDLNIIEADPDDDKFLACAKAGSADYIITNDVHLLSLKRFENTEIITPREFMERPGQNIVS